jgi:pimeloyl-ACP methyl ester carboxylesterase
MRRSRQESTPTIGRRSAVGSLGGLAAGLLFARRSLADDGVDPDDLRNLKLLDLNEGGRRFVLIVPRYQNPDTPIPLVVFLHGLGETSNERLGAYAWVERYGLGSAWQRMKRDPIERTSKRGEWTDARLAEVNAELAARPFRGFAMACPFMPNPRGAADLDAYAKWIEASLVPRCRKEARVATEPGQTWLCGVSLGGYVSLEMLVRLPHLFGAWAGLQTAIGTWAAAGYAEKIAKAGPKPLLVLTSTLDHWKASSEALAAAFDTRSVRHTLRVVPGPHDQPWLREAGTIEALHWLDRLVV